MFFGALKLYQRSMCERFSVGVHLFYSIAILEYCKAQSYSIASVEKSRGYWEERRRCDDSNDQVIGLLARVVYDHVYVAMRHDYTLSMALRGV